MRPFRVANLEAERLQRDPQTRKLMLAGPFHRLGDEQIRGCSVSQNVRAGRRAVVAVLPIVAALLSLWILFMAVSPAQASSESPASSKKVTLRVGWMMNPDNLNPFVGYQTTSYVLYHLNYDLLVKYDQETLQPKPGLAESWEHSADGKTWTFHIRKGVKWQDGEPFTAHDVAFTYNYIIDNEMGAYTMYTTYIEKVEATDDYTAVFTCSQPVATMLQGWVPILPEHIWAKIDPKKAGTTFRNDPPVVGTGPFQVVEWKKNSYVRLVANKDYWGGAPHIDELIFRIYTTPESLADDLRTGAIDLTSALGEAQYNKFKGMEGFGAIKTLDDCFRSIGINVYAKESLGNPVLLDPEFRRALACAVDHEKIAKIAYQGMAIPADSMLPSGYWKEPLDYHWTPPADQRQDFDLEKAAQMLEEAGYKDSDGDGVREYKGEPIKLRLWALADQPAYASAGKLITDWYQQIGLDIDFSVHDDGYVSDHVYNTVDGKLTPDYDLFVWGWDGDYDPGFLLSVYLTSQINQWSDSGWSNAEYDRLFEEQAACLDPQERKDIIWQMEELFYNEAPNIVLVYPQGADIYDTEHWTGWLRQPGGSGTVANEWTYLNLRPKVAATGDEGSSTGLIVGIVVAAVVVIGGVVWFVVHRRRRGGEAEEAE